MWKKQKRFIFRPLKPVHLCRARILLDFEYSASTSTNQGPDVINRYASKDAPEAVYGRYPPVFKGEYGREHKEGNCHEDSRHNRVSRHAKRPFHLRPTPSKKINGSNKEHCKERLSYCGVLVHVLEVCHEQNYNRAGALRNHRINGNPSLCTYVACYGWEQCILSHGVVDPRPGDDKGAYCSQECQSDGN